MNVDLLLLVPLVLAELAILVVALLVLWVLAVGTFRRRAARRESRAEAFAVALDARRERAAARSTLADSHDPLDRLQAEYEGGAWAVMGIQFCDLEATSTPHAWRADGARRCISCKHITTVGGPGE